MRVERVRVPIEGLPASFDGFTILFLSDFHLGAGTTNAAQLLTTVRSSRFDLCVLGGDYFEDGSRPRFFETLVKALQAKAPVFAVWGNHDHYFGIPRLRRLFRKLKIRVLENSSAPLRRGRAAIDLVGVDVAVRDDDYVGDRSDLELALRGSKNPIRILVSHAPDLVLRQPPREIALILSGHTHGGQVRIPFLGQVYASSAVPKRKLNGLSRHAETWLYVTRGLGESGVFGIPLAVRLNCPYEATLLTLEAR